mmetsp:Transcript_12890/g.30431  ORF Transcript_12890/g.30431 Transcript_12890/m.30431 type:complete len:373 (-) Transcript_12890:207-1325(-)
MPVLRNVDVFVKPRADVRTQSASGGIINLLAASVAFFLFLGQVYLSIFPDQSHSLHLSESMQFPMLAEDVVDPFQKRLYDIKGKFSLYFKVTFLHISCENLDVTFNGEPVRGDNFAGYPKSSDNGKRRTIQKYKPRTVDRRKIFGSEHSAEAKLHEGRGCTLVGNMKVPIVAGHLAITMTPGAWMEALNFIMTRSRSSQKSPEQPVKYVKEVNATHFVHDVRFGKRGTVSKGLTSSGYVPPLEDRMRSVDNEFFGVVKDEIGVKLIPTIHASPGIFDRIFGNGGRPYYQMSVVEHMIQPETMIRQKGSSMPGIVVNYDVTPLAVHINEINEDGGFFGFLSSLIAIVGGCFVTVGLFGRCAVGSVEAISKKVD